MNYLTNYLLQSALALAIFYLPYRLLLHRDTCFGLNRIILLLSLLSSMILPLISLCLEHKLPAAIPSFYLDIDASVTPVTVTHSNNAEKIQDLWHAIKIIYIFGALIVMARLLYQTYCLRSMAKHSKVFRRKNHTIVLIDANITPFSYFNRIYIPLSEVSSNAFESIVQHEEIHLTQKHFIDLFLIEIITIIQWFNPIVWMYERSLKEIQEYLTDQAMISLGHNKGEYQALLVNQALGGPIFTLTNQFNQSLIKKRILMMTKMRTPKMAQLKVLLFFPILAALLMAFSNPRPMTTPAEKSLRAIFPALTKVSREEVKTDPIIKDYPSNKMAPDSSYKGEVYQQVEQMPEYPGGINELMAFLSANLKYPAEAIENNNEGIVYVKFIVDPNGNVIRPKIVRGVSKECNEEAIRVVKLFPKWKPARHADEAVAVFFTLPVKFKLTRKKNITEQNITKLHKEKDFEDADQLPEYPGGTKELSRFISTHIKYPSEASKNKIEGRVFVKFIIDKEGNVVDPIIFRGIGGGCDEEALRVVKTFPKWKPAFKNGQPISIYFTVPILYKL